MPVPCPRRLWLSLLLALALPVQAQETAPTHVSPPASEPVPPVVPPADGVPAGPPPTEPLPAAPQTPAQAPAPATPELPSLTPGPPAADRPVLVEVPAGPPGSSLRGLWVDAFGPGLKTRAQVQQLVNDAAALGVNTLFVQAIRRGDCLCMKSGLPLITDKALEKNFDPPCHRHAAGARARPQGHRVGERDRHRQRRRPEHRAGARDENARPEQRGAVLAGPPPRRHVAGRQGRLAGRRGFPTPPSS